MQRLANSNSVVLSQKNPKLIDITIETIKNVSNLDKITSSPIQNHHMSYNMIAEILQKNHPINYNNIIETMKTLKNIDPDQQKQLESILSSKNDEISNITMKEIIGNLTSDGNGGVQNAIYQSQNNNNTMSIGIKSSNDKKSNDDFMSQEILSGDDSETDSLSIKSLIPRKDGINLIDSVKENLDYLLKANLIKRKNAKKKWWTPEEV